MTQNNLSVTDGYVDKVSVQITGKRYEVGNMTADDFTAKADTPGILWPKFDDQQVAIKLGYTGAIKDDVMDVCELADSLLGFLWENYKGNVIARKAT